MRAIIETQVVLDEPSADQGLVTWFDVRMVEGFDGADGAVAGRARVARVHVGAALDVGESLGDVLDADSGELAALYPVFFDEGGLRDEFVQGAGSDLLYVGEVRLEPGWDGRNIELALVRRLCDTLGQGCDVAVVSCASDADVARWQRMGFAPSGKDGRHAHLALASRQARVVPSDDFSRYKIVANPPPGRDQH
ncbi:MAG: hypothetical protein ABI895_06705 [Deltaproteobacteria bacterium]